MKRLISILMLIIIVTATVSAFAEATTEEVFSVRNGIQFGMTMDEVDKIETSINCLSPGYRRYKETEDTLSYHADLIDGINIVRASSHTIDYTFSKETGELKSFLYWFGYDIASEYDALKSAYWSKYGMPRHENDGFIFDKTPTVLESFMRGELSRFCKLTAYCQWLVQYEDYYILINIFTLDNNQMHAEFTKITNEEMEELT